MITKGEKISIETYPRRPEKLKLADSIQNISYGRRLLKKIDIMNKHVRTLLNE